MAKLASSPADLAEMWAASMDAESNRLLARLNLRQRNLLRLVERSLPVMRLLMAKQQAYTLATFAGVLRGRRMRNEDDTTKRDLRRRKK